MDESGFNLSGDNDNNIDGSEHHQYRDRLHSSDSGREYPQQPPPRPPPRPIQKTASRRRSMERSLRRHEEEAKLSFIIGWTRRLGFWGVLAIAMVFLSSKVSMPATFDAKPAAQDPHHSMKAYLMQEYNGEMLYDAYYPAPEKPIDGKYYLIQVKASAVPPPGYYHLLETVKNYPFTHYPASALAKYLFPLPKLYGLELAGIVLQNYGDASRFEVGDRVAGHLPMLGTPWGTHTEYVVVEEPFLGRMGPHTSFATAAATPAVALAAIPALKQIQKQQQQLAIDGTILVHAQDAVGSFALQYAKQVLKLSNIVATTSSPAYTPFLKELGANTVVSFDQAFKGKTCRGGNKDNDNTNNACFDVVFELQSQSAHHLLKRRGQYLNDVPLYMHSSSANWKGALKTIGLFLRFKAINAVKSGILPNFHIVFGVVIHPNPTVLQEALDLVDRGTIRPIIQRKRHISETDEAYKIWLTEATRSPTSKTATAIGKVVIYHSGRDEAEEGDQNIDYHQMRDHQDRQRKEAENKAMEAQRRWAEEEARAQEEQRRKEEKETARIQQEQRWRDEEENKAREEQRWREEEENKAREQQQWREEERNREREQQRWREEEENRAREQQQWREQEEQQRRDEETIEQPQEQQQSDAQQEHDSWDAFVAEEQRHNEEVPQEAVPDQQ